MPSRSVSEGLLVVARGIVGAAAFVANLCLIGILVIIFTNVVLRYVIRTPLYWGDEAVINLLIVMVYASFGHVLIEGGHIRMTILFERLPGRVQNVLWILVSLLGTAYASFLLYAVIQLVLDSLRIGSFSMITRWPIAPWQMLVALGLFCLLVAFIILVTARIGIALGTRKAEKVKEKEAEVLY
jgi:TRAP-type C4-dicarboxylate transport system permease small subunit